MVRAVALLLLVGSGACGKVGAPHDAGAPARDAVEAVDALPDAPMIDGLVAWYRMDVATGGTIEDASGHHHDGSCDPARCPAFTLTGKIGGAYVFDGVDDLFHVTSAAELEGPSEFTVTAWVNRAEDTSKDGCVINKSYQASGANSWQACIRVPDGQLAFFSNAEGSGDTQISVKLETSRWYHLALWWDGSTKATYVDGTRVAFTENVPVAFDSADINIGTDLDGPTLVAPFRGQVDDVRVYNRALSQVELNALQHP
jgi:hypothetical protein